ncbi:hypothetical protein [Streptomyces soliscabiei]|uniref:hypothetical protein n=1 Tax=Streptomyces soliscabiei TaxID=588897 RepID=UPI0029A36D85|nr:hypothetical protein [Streptomyces sp. NY05-11A]MDX2682634.1 hypothetical protein [Streptomyces sp. NY05-11A]
MIGLYILGGMLLFGAFKFLRGVYFIRKPRNYCSGLVSGSWSAVVGLLGSLSRRVSWG